MANGFKGTNIRIESLELSSANGVPAINVRIQFVDDEGVVHGLMRHTLLAGTATDGTDRITEVLKELMDLVVQRLEALHFESPNLPVQQVIHGIAESISGGADSSSDPITQG